jgi:SRSO17 transposase
LPPRFGRKESQEHSRIYLNGLLLGQGRKSVEPIALNFGHACGQPKDQSEVIALQRFLSQSPWQATDVQQEIQAVFRERLVPSTAQWAIGTVAVIDESSFVKRGKESVGVVRQHCGRLGKIENCQVGVFLVGVTPAGSALLDHQLHLTEEWVQDKERRKKAHVPEELSFWTKPQIALQLLERAEVPFDWVTADDLYGRNGSFLNTLEERSQRYMVEIPGLIRVWIDDPANWLDAEAIGKRPSKRVEREAVRRADQVARSLPAAAWQPLRVREGANGPLVFEFACVRVWAMRHRKAGPPIWLVLQRSLGPNPQLHYYLSNAPIDTPLQVFAEVAGCRWRVEEFLEEGKSYLGMADYEARGWSSWHHHMSLVALAHLYVTLTRLHWRPGTPRLTLDMAVHLLQASLPRPQLTEADALALIEYHLRRNAVAQASHRKTWIAKHKNVSKKLLL